MPFLNDRAQGRRLCVLYHTERHAPRDDRRGVPGDVHRATVKRRRTERLTITGSLVHQRRARVSRRQSAVLAGDIHPERFHDTCVLHVLHIAHRIRSIERRPGCSRSVTEVRHPHRAFIEASVEVRRVRVGVVLIEVREGGAKLLLDRVLDRKHVLVVTGL